MRTRPSASFVKDNGANVNRGPYQKKFRDFTEGKGLNPTSKAFGFIMDVNLFKVGHMIREKKYLCKIMPKNYDSYAIQEIALKEGLIFVTKNFHVFKDFPSERKCLVNNKLQFDGNKFL